MYKKILLITSYIIILIANSLITKYLSKNNVDGSFILFNRGLICFLIILSAAIIYKRSLKPNNIKIQTVRFFVAGMGLFCITNSFKFVHAATISLIQRSELLLVIIVSAILSRKFFNIKTLYSLIISIFLFLFLFFFKNPDENNAGIWLGLVGTGFVIAGYFLIKKVVVSETFLVITMTSALGSIFFGLSYSVYKHSINYSINPLLLFLLFILGAFMFIIYRLTVYIYKEYDVENAQYFSLIAIFLTIPLEYIFIGNTVETTYAIGLIVFSILVSGAILMPSRKMKKRPMSVLLDSE